MREFTLKENQHLQELDIIKGLLQEESNFIIQSRTNTGKTEACINEAKKSGQNFIFAVDSKVLADQLGVQYSLPVYYVGKSKPKSNCITLYNHIRQFVEPNTLLFVDEFHSIIKDYGYKSEVIDDMLKSFHGFKQVIGLTGTPIADMIGFENVKINKHRDERTINHITNSNYLEPLIYNIINNPNKVHYISIFDKSNEAIKIASYLVNNGFKESEITFINSDRKDSIPFKQLIKERKIEGYKVIFTTYTQGFNIEGCDYMLHLIPLANALISAEDIEQVINRFRNETPVVNLYWNYVDGCVSSFNEEYELTYNLKMATEQIKWWEREFNWTEKNLTTNHCRVIHNHLIAESIGIVTCHLKPNLIKIQSNIHTKRTTEMYADINLMKSILKQTGYALYSKEEINNIVKTDAEKALELKAAIDEHRKNKQKERLLEIYNSEFEDYPNDELNKRFNFLLKYYPRERAYNILDDILLAKKPWNKLVRKLNIIHPSTIIDKAIQTKIYAEFLIGEKYSVEEAYKKLQKVYKELNMQAITTSTKSTITIGEYFVIKKCKVPGKLKNRLNGIEIIQRVAA